MMCRYLKRFDETEGMETAEILYEKCIPCHEVKSGVDIFCPDYKIDNFPILELDWHEVMHRRGYK